MSKEKKVHRHESSSDFSKDINAQAKRKLKAQRKKNRNIWFGFGMFGLVGWSVSIPVLLGAMIGIWADKQYPGPHSWTLILLVAGLCVGCWNAMHWINRENREMLEEEDSDD